MEPVITEKSVVKLTISSWFHVVVILATIVGIYFAIRNDVSLAIAQSNQNAQDLKAAQQSIVDMRMDVRAVKDNVDWFRQQYERDMSRYIRNTPEK